MDRPGIITEPETGTKPETGKRCVGRTQSIEEAQRMAQRYEMEGFTAEIVRKTRTGITVFEVWVSRAPDAFSGRQPMHRE